MPRTNKNRWSCSRPSYETKGSRPCNYIWAFISNSVTVLLQFSLDGCLFIYYVNFTNKSALSKLTKCSVEVKLFFHLTALMRCRIAEPFGRDISLVCKGEELCEQNMLLRAVIFFGAKEEFTAEKRGIHTNLGNHPCPLSQQQRYQSKQHQLCPK